MALDQHIFTQDSLCDMRHTIIGVVGGAGVSKPKCWEASCALYHIKTKPTRSSADVARGSCLRKMPKCDDITLVVHEKQWSVDATPIGTDKH
ncbi:hypothetical protein KC353_g23 [Hortaea werneckii]|nr:hypothetical protein KC353_g23 [Hortaea werneckii]